MKDMNCISVELAERMHQLMAERYHLQMRIQECENNLYKAFTDWAREATGVREGDDFYFKGRKVVLSGYNVTDLSYSFIDIPGRIGALIRLKPETTEGPTIFKPDEISVKDFQHQEAGNNGGNDDRKD